MPRLALTPGPHLQVFDLQHFRPAPVLKQIWANFDEAVAGGDAQAELVRRCVPHALHALYAPHGLQKQLLLLGRT